MTLLGLRPCDVYSKIAGIGIGSRPRLDISIQLEGRLESYPMPQPL